MMVTVLSLLPQPSLSAWPVKGDHPVAEDRMQLPCAQAGARAGLAFVLGKTAQVLGRRHPAINTRKRRLCLQAAVRAEACTSPTLPEPHDLPAGQQKSCPCPPHVRPSTIPTPRAVHEHWLWPTPSHTTAYKGHKERTFLPHPCYSGPSHHHLGQGASTEGEIPLERGIGGWGRGLCQSFLLPQGLKKLQAPAQNELGWRPQGPHVAK